jgi:uncharacterized membrane-anchored protein
MNIEAEINTVTSSLEELATRISKMVDGGDDTMSSDLYRELVAAERTINALLRRLSRASRRMG